MLATTGKFVLQKSNNLSHSSLTFQKSNLFSTLNHFGKVKNNSFFFKPANNFTFKRFAHGNATPKDPQLNFQDFRLGPMYDYTPEMKYDSKLPLDEDLNPNTWGPDEDLSSDPRFFVVGCGLVFLALFLFYKYIEGAHESRIVPGEREIHPSVYEREYILPVEEFKKMRVHLLKRD